jgi:hypothetical protein
MNPAIGLENLLAEPVRGDLVETANPLSLSDIDLPPKVEYRLTPLGLSLGAAFCGVWVWAAENLDQVEQARPALAFRRQPRGSLLRQTRRWREQGFAPCVPPRG